MNLSSTSPLKDILSSYSPTRVRKIRLTPGSLSTFWRIASLVLAFVLGIVFWQWFNAMNATPNSICKPTANTTKKIFENFHTDKTSSFQTIPKGVDKFLFAKKRPVKTDKLIILYGRDIWTKFDSWDSSDWKSKCSRQDCAINFELSSIPASSAVVFNALQMPSTKHKNLLQKTRRQSGAESKFVFLSGVTPLNTSFDAEDYDLFFDLTVTYKRDSDVRIPYWPNDLILPSMYGLHSTNYNDTTTASDYDPDMIQGLFHVLGKQKFMLCIVKTCKASAWSSSFIRKLRDEGVVDIYTLEKCDNDNGDVMPIKDAKPLPCASLFTDECVRFVEQYKFVAITLDEYCDGYVPREYWYAITAWQTIPVLWGCFSEDLIKNTFINALEEEYISPTFKKALSVSKDPQNYLKFSFGNNERRGRKFYWQCELCKLLHGEKRSAKTLLSFAEFWDKDQDCNENSQNYKLAKAQLVRTGAISGD
eukprot:gene7188-7994_t